MLKQSVNQVTVKTGGKLYIAGEYSVETPELYLQIHRREHGTRRNCEEGFR